MGKGADAVRRVARRARRIADQATPAEVLREAQHLAAAMRQRAATHSRSGALAGSIAARVAPSGAVQVVAGGAATRKEVRRGSGVYYDYARAQEFGTAEQDAQPFFYPTYRAQRAGIRRRLKQALKARLKAAGAVE